jgi:hypothetical protein
MDWRPTGAALNHLYCPRAEAASFGACGQVDERRCVSEAQLLVSETVLVAAAEAQGLWSRVSMRPVRKCAASSAPQQRSKVPEFDGNNPYTLAEETPHGPQTLRLKLAGKLRGVASCSGRTWRTYPGVEQYPTSTIWTTLLLAAGLLGQPVRGSGLDHATCSVPQSASM